MINVPVPVNGSKIWTFSLAKVLPKCFLKTTSTDLTIKSTTSTGVKTIPNLSVVDLNPVEKNLSYRVIMIFCLAWALSIPSARRRTES